MRWLIALGLVVAACSGSGSNNPSTAQGEAGEGGDAPAAGGSKQGSAGSSGSAGAASRAGAGAGGEAGEGNETGGSAGLPGSSGAGGAAGEPTIGGQGGEFVTPAGGEGGGGWVPPIGSGGEGGAPADACEGVLPWDPIVPWTELVKNELRTLRGELWRCSSQAQCTTYPGHETAPGWKKVADCADPNEGGEPACQCAAGACCDGCYFRPRSHFCGEVVRYTSCRGDVVQACGGATETLDRDYWNLFCTGDTGGECTRWGAHTRFHGLTCEQGTGCLESGDQASCSACPN